MVKGAALSITLNIYKGLCVYTDGLEKLEVTGETIGECLKDLIDRYPNMQNALFDAKGKLLGYIKIYLNRVSTSPDELKKPVKDGDEIHIQMIITGG